jgi:hypothetical protein
MFEREIKFIYDFNLNKVNRLGPYFTFEQLSQVDLHPAILQYISAEIDYLIFEDRQKLLRKSVFDYSGEKITGYFNSIADEVKATKRFTQEYVAKLILHATSFTINYLIQPRWTLLKFVFDESNHKTTNEIKQILKYVYYYKHSVKIIIEYINSKKILSMNDTEFEELLIKSDLLAVESYLNAVYHSALNSMAEFLNIGEVQKNKISLGAIITFLEEKGQKKHTLKLKSVFGNDESAKFKITDINRILNSVVIEKTENIAEIETQQEMQFEDKNESLVIESDDVDEPVHEEETVAMNLNETGVKEEINLAGFEEEIPADEPVKEQLTDFNLQNLIFEIEEKNVEKVRPLEEIDNTEISEEPEKASETDYNFNFPDEEIDSMETAKDAAEDLNFEMIEKINNDDEELSNIPDDDKIEITGITENSNDDNYIHTFGFVFEDEKEELGNEENSSTESPVIVNGLPEYELRGVEEEKDDIEDEKNDEVIEEFDLNDYQQIQKIEEEKLGFINEFEYKDESEDHDSELTDSKVEDNEIEQNPFLKSIPPEMQSNKKIDINDLLEQKDMTKIIEVVFDYDIEDFATTIEEISACKNVDDAHFVINEALKKRGVAINSKEAQIFRGIISQSFES